MNIPLSSAFRACLRAAPAIAVGLISCGCGRRMDANAIVLRGAGTKLVGLAPESASLRRILGDEEVRQRELDRSHRGSPDDLALRREFVASVEALTSIQVPAGTDAEIVESSPCFCDDHPHTTPTMLKVRVEAGPSKGAEGWICETSVAHEGPGIP